MQCFGALSVSVTADAKALLSSTTLLKDQDSDTTMDSYLYVMGTTKGKLDYMEWGRRAFSDSTDRLARVNSGS